MIGINLSGAEFGGGSRYGYDYIYPSASDINFYAEQGVEFVRLPVRWERLQPTVGGKLDAAEVGRLQEFLANADAAGVKVLVDLHNYGGYWGNKIGGNVISVANFADFWSQLATEIKGSPALAGYDLMNEPYGFPDWESWPRAAQAAVDAIRKLDMTHDIYVEGDQMASSHNWTAANPLLDIKDPADKIIYEAHVYFDRWGSGTSFGTVAEEGVGLNIGAERIADFVSWLKAHDAKGFIGEFAVPNTDPAWLTVLDNFLKEMDKQGLSGTYWGGGSWWGNYPLSPRNADGSPRPQLDVLKQHFADSAGQAEIGVPVTVGMDFVATNAVEQFTGHDGQGTVNYVRSTTGVDIDLTRNVQQGGAAQGDKLTDIVSVTGSNYADTLRGDAKANAFHGGGGNDVLIATEGGDTLDGGDGEDTVDYRLARSGITVDLAKHSGGLGDTLESIENVTGSASNDWIVGDDSANRLEGMGGKDELRGGGGNDSIYGGDGDDHVLGGDGDDHIEGGDGNDELGGDAGNDHILGGAGNDAIGGNGGLNTLEGGAGDDHYYVETGTDTVVERSGEGWDTVHSWVSYTLSDNVERIELWGDGATNATGNDLSNWVRGNNAANTLSGMGGDDTVRGEGGNDTMYGGVGNDHLLGGDGNDRIEGGNGNDELGGDAGDDHILGGAGNDALGGNGGLNTLEGGAGDDHYYVETGTDIVVERAGEGWDTVHSWVSYILPDNVEGIELMGNAAISTTGNDLSNWIRGNAASNTLSGMGGDDTMHGEGGNDTMYGDVGNDHLLGGDGNDRIEGGDGNDELGGDAGDDRIVGGAGDDHLGGNGGADILEGGADADTFWYDFIWESSTNAPDHIVDFQSGADKIAVQHVDANARQGGDQAFAFIGTADFSHNAGELRYNVMDGSAVVQADVDGDGQADFSIILDHVTQVKASDFYL